MPDSINYYNNTYDNFRAAIAADIRRETVGEDIGQNSWLTADEYRRCFEWLQLNPNSHVLEVASGSGGPALFMAKTTGCRITAVDNNDSAIATANELAREQGMSDRVQFQAADASLRLPFEAGSFDAVVCIDAINHLANRLEVLKDWNRVLKAGGYVLFTDPITVTGLLTNEEIAIRSSIGFFLFAPPEEDARLIREAGFELVRREDATENVAQIAGRWHEARAKREQDLIQIEGETTYQGTQKFFAVAHKISSERRLSRFIFVARKGSR
jgi:cyclopropane fatty-acyl-phospholipid synthase-like methyltransferase